MMGHGLRLRLRLPTGHKAQLEWYHRKKGKV